jgi:hypothetical protein
MKLLEADDKMRCQLPPSIRASIAIVNAADALLYSDTRPAPATTRFSPSCCAWLLTSNLTGEYRPSRVV